MDSDPLKPSRFLYVARSARRVATDPHEAFEKLLERAASRYERWARRGQEAVYPPDPDWERHLHDLLGEPWPCPEVAEFPSVWSGVVETMQRHGRRVGRQSYGGDDDADAGLARSLWCLVRHLRPSRVVETGVAHGVSTRCILEALERNGRGELWSVDLPPLTIPERRSELGIAVPADTRRRWTYVEGSSRRRLPRLVRELGEIDLFLHDSRHSTRNTRWELELAWSALAPGGVAMADDVDHNWGFKLFAEGLPDADTLNCPADDGRRVFGIARKRPPHFSVDADQNHRGQTRSVAPVAPIE